MVTPKPARTGAERSEGAAPPVLSRRDYELLNPINGTRTGFSPSEDTPLILEGSYRNVALREPPAAI